MYLMLKMYHLLLPEHQTFLLQHLIIFSLIPFENRLQYHHIMALNKTSQSLHDFVIVLSSDMS